MTIGLAVLGVAGPATYQALNADQAADPALSSGGNPTVQPSPPSSAGPTTRPLRLPRTGPAIRDPLDSRSGFVHPGIVVNARQLEYVRDQVNAGAQPWVTAFEGMRRSRHASLSWQPRPRPTVECGPYSVPNLGCEEEESDAVAAYTHALLWYLTGDHSHAGKAVGILDAWSGVVRQHTNRNAPLQAAWSAVSFARAAEIMRHTYAGWSSDRVATMFRTVYLPLVIRGAPRAGGNWELILLNAAVNIAVFLNDRELFNQILTRTRGRAAAFVYLAGDGRYPTPPPGGTRDGIVKFWYGQSSFISGLSQETCRDFGHTGWGLAALAHIAETARLQGVDLYADLRQRMVSALEFHAGFELGDPVPGWLCGGNIRRGFEPAPEVAYNHYAMRLGIPLPKTGKLLESLPPAAAGFFYGWETLTHAGNPY